MNANNYFLEKIAIDRATKEMQKGELSPEALERMKQAGMIRSPLRYAYGLKKGSENLANKNGYKTVYYTNSLGHTGYPSARDIYEKTGIHPDQAGGAFTHPEAKIIYAEHPFIGGHSNAKTQLNSSMINFHEANEALYNRKKQNTITLHNQPISKSKVALDSYMYEPNEIGEAQEKIIKEKYGDKFTKLPTKERIEIAQETIHHPDVKAAQEKVRNDVVNNKLTDRYKTVGMHVSPHVLLNEANMMSKMPYQHYFYGDSGELGSARLATGENSYLTRVTGRNVYRAGKRPGDAKKLWREFNNAETVKVGREKYNNLNMAPLDENKVYHYEQNKFNTPENIAKYNEEKKQLLERAMSRNKYKRLLDKLKKFKIRF